MTKPRSAFFPACACLLDGFGCSGLEDAAVLGMCHKRAAERTGLVAFSMHFPWHQDLQVMSLDGKTPMPRREPPAWSHPAISASGE